MDKCFPFFFPVAETSTSYRRQLLYHHCRFPSSRRWITSNRRWLPFKCRPAVCLSTELATGRSELFFNLT